MKNLVTKINSSKNFSILEHYNFEKKRKDNFFIADEILGKITKNDFDKKIFVLAEFFRKFEEKNIGVLLPSSAFCSIVIFALYLAEKTPVMLNWTLSEEGFNHCFESGEIKNIISSENFLKKISISFLKKYEENYIFLEEIPKKISFSEKIKGLYKKYSRKIPKIKEHETAVILFTSGTEFFPKAIKLSHKNIIENIRGTLQTMEVKEDDYLLGFLPAFHSFGFTINTILPIITGLRVFYTPNPSDSHKIISIIDTEKISIITSTPTFLKMILELEETKKILSLKTAIVGSESCSDNIFEKAKNIKNLKIIEGYGATECSPVISVNTKNLQKRGSVGKILKNLECKIINTENKKIQEIGEKGEICIYGDSVFAGYCDKNIENPFIEIEGKKFYKTGDIGYIDKDNFLFISGRLKRFIKIGGEMISLSMIEKTLEKNFGEIYIETIEENEKIKIITFSKNILNTNEINNFLLENNIPKIIKISKHIKVDNFPILGTGKINYTELKKIIKKVEKIEKNIDFNDVENILKEKIRELIENENLDISKESEFGKDIIIDSIDAGELIIFIRKKYNITAPIEISKIKNFNDLLIIIKEKGNQK